jgi:hypothetical protein
MDLAIYTVCTKGGATVYEEDRKPVAHIAPVLAGGKPTYSFYATNGEKDKDNKLIVPEVDIVLPLGGENGGFFRFPQVGDKVLVGRLGNTTISSMGKLVPPSGAYVLMGYLPSGEPAKQFYWGGGTDYSNGDDTTATIPGFRAGQKNPASLKDFQGAYGTALRYNRDQTGKTKTEIGFYRKKAKWSNTNYSGGGSTQGMSFPDQDTLNIQSAGDIETRADNYQLLRAKRLEILVNKEELSPELRYANAHAGTWDYKKAPTGDSALDDPMLHGGELHIRAGRDVIIKADREIRLQVGRTTLVINDGGFNVVTSKVSSGVPVPYDTSFTMNPRSGISMSGEKINIAGANGFALGDAWGAAVNAMFGGLTLTGRFVKLANVNKFAECFLHVANTIEAAQSMMVTGGSIAKNLTADKLAQRGMWLDATRTFINDIAGVWPFIALAPGAKWLDAHVNQTPAAMTTMTSEPVTGKVIQDGNAANPLDTGEPIEVLLLFLNLALSITNMVYQSIETNWANKWLDDIRGISEGNPAKYSSADKAKDRDMLYMISTMIDQSIITVALDAAMFASVISGIPGSSAEIRMRPSGDLVLKGAAYKLLYGTLGTSDSTFPLFASRAAMAGINAVNAGFKLGADIAKAVSTNPAAYQRVKPWLETL